MPLPHSKTRVGYFATLSPVFPVMRVQLQGSRKGFGHSWLVAYRSKIPLRCALAGLAGDIVHNLTYPESDMLECFRER